MTQIQSPVQSSLPFDRGNLHRFPPVTSLRIIAKDNHSIYTLEKINISVNLNLQFFMQNSPFMAARKYVMSQVQT